MALRLLAAPTAFTEVVSRAQCPSGILRLFLRGMLVGALHLGKLCTPNGWTVLVLAEVRSVDLRTLPFSEIAPLLPSGCRLYGLDAADSIGHAAKV